MPKLNFDFFKNPLRREDKEKAESSKEAYEMASDIANSFVTKANKIAEIIRSDGNLLIDRPSTYEPAADNIYSQVIASGIPITQEIILGGVYIAQSAAREIMSPISQNVNDEPLSVLLLKISKSDKLSDSNVNVGLAIVIAGRNRLSIIKNHRIAREQKILQEQIQLGRGEEAVLEFTAFNLIIEEIFNKMEDYLHQIEVELNE